MHNYTKEEMLKTGIYKITCTQNLKFYIGSAAAFKASDSKKGFYRRLQRHLLALNANKHHNKILQNSWNKYGEKSFKFEILEFCLPHLCIEREQYYLDILQPFYPIGFNICINSLNNTKTIVKNSNTQNRDLSILNKELRKTIYQFDLQGNFIKEFNGIAKTQRELGINNIFACCLKKQHSAGGFIWKYKEPKTEIIKRPKFNIKITNIIDNSFKIYDNYKLVRKDFNYCKSTLYLYEKNNLLIDNKYKIEKIFL